MHGFQTRGSNACGNGVARIDATCRMSLSQRRVGWLLLAGTVYAILDRGWVGIVVRGLSTGVSSKNVVSTTPSDSATPALRAAPM